MSHRKGFLLSSCLLAALGAPTLLMADSVLLDSGETVKGEIARETIKGISIQTGSGSRNYARNQIAPEGITYDPQPQQFPEAKDALRARDFAKAHRLFRAIAAQADSAGGADSKKGGKAGTKGKSAPKVVGTIRPIFHQHALYYEILTYKEEGNPAGAIAAVDELLKRYPDSWYLQEVLLLKVRLSMEGGGDASAAVTEAIKAAGDAGAGEDVADQIRLVQAENLLKQKKMDEALKLFQALTRSVSKAVAERAKLAIAQIQLSKGELVPAKMAFNELIRSSKDRATLCGASRGLGDVQVEEMKKDKKTAEGLREALESYLRAAVLHFPAQGDPVEAHQAALLSGAECAEEILKLTDAKKFPRVAEGYRTVARDLYREINQTYPRSEAARKATSALQRLSPGTLP